MKGKVIIGLVTVIALLTAVMVVQFVKTLQEKESITAKTQNLPSFSLTDVHGNTLTNQDIPKDNWVVFVFFHSECHYCHSEASQLHELLSELGNITFLWFSPEKIGTIKDFQKTYNLEHIPFVSDTNFQFADAWGISKTPQFLVYTPKRKLFKNHKGALRIDKLVSQIHETKIH